MQKVRNADSAPPPNSIDHADPDLAASRARSRKLRRGGGSGQGSVNTEVTPFSKCIETPGNEQSSAANRHPPKCGFYFQSFSTKLLAANPHRALMTDFNNWLLDIPPNARLVMLVCTLLVLGILMFVRTTRTDYVTFNPIVWLHSYPLGARVVAFVAVIVFCLAVAFGKSFDNEKWRYWQSEPLTDGPSMALQLGKIGSKPEDLIIMYDNTAPTVSQKEAGKWHVWYRRAEQGATYKFEPGILLNKNSIVSSDMVFLRTNEKVPTGVVNDQGNARLSYFELKK